MRHRGIALVAPRKSGKTTAANVLVEMGFTRIGLADEVKGIAVDVVNFMLDECEMGGELRPTCNVETIAENKAVFRPLLEWIGVTFGREYLNTPDRWIHLFDKRVAETIGPIVCDDMRLPNEAEALREMGFLIVRIHRPAHLREMALDYADEPLGPMPSEVATDEIAPDFVINNGGDLEALTERVSLLGGSLMWGLAA